MKYGRLSKEQFEELHKEFAVFLATQGIDSQKWNLIKSNDPKKTDHYLDTFSDVVWDRVLQNAEYVEHMTPQQLFLFKVSEREAQLISVKVENKSIDITTADGYRWLQEHLMDDQVILFTSKKAYQNSKNQEVFSFLQKGAVLTKGELFRYFEKMLQGTNH